MKEVGRAFGLRCGELLGTYDLDSSSWKTSQRLLFEDCCESLDRSPESIILHKGQLYELPTLEPITKERDTGLLRIPTIGANEYKGSSRKRYKGSKHFRGAKTSEGLRTCETDPIYLNPLFAELMMGYPRMWTDLNVSVTPLSLKSQKSCLDR